jgi:DNA-binding NarL/FixJ family response regulator
MAIRVFLVLPAIPRAVVTRLLDAADDIDVVGAVSDLAALDHAVALAHRADVVLVSGDGSSAAEAFEHLGLNEIPAIMAIDPTDTTVELHEVIPQAQALGDLSAADFVQAIRTVSRPQEARWH